LRWCQMRFEWWSVQSPAMVRYPVKN